MLYKIVPILTVFVLFKIQSFDECSKKQTWTDGYSEYCGKYLSADAIEEESSLSSSGKVLYSDTPSYLLNALPFDRTLMESTCSSRLFEMPYFSCLFCLIIANQRPCRIHKKLFIWNTRYRA